MPAGELVASLADVGLVAVLQASDEVMRVGEPGGLLNLLGARLLAVQPLGDVGEDRAGEEDGLLADEADLASEVAHVERAQVVAIERDRAADGVVEALEQHYRRRLSAARLSDEGDCLAGRTREVELLGDEEVGPRRVGEVDVLALDGALDVRRLEAARVVHPVDLYRLVEEAERGEHGLGRHLCVGHADLRVGHAKGGEHGHEEAEDDLDEVGPPHLVGVGG